MTRRARGELWWADLDQAGARPVVVLTHRLRRLSDEAVRRLRPALSVEAGCPL